MTSVQLRGWALQHPVFHPDLPKRIGVRGLLWGDRRDVEHRVAELDETTAQEVLVAAAPASSGLERQFRCQVQNAHG